MEDDFLLRESAMAALEHAGFEPLSASHADEAIEILHSRQDVEVVFSDIQMAGSMDAIQADADLIAAIGSVMVAA